MLINICIEVCYRYNYCIKKKSILDESNINVW